MKLDCVKCGEKVDRGLVLHAKCFKYYIRKIKRLEKKLEHSTQLPIFYPSKEGK